MKTTKIFLMAALALMTAACSNSDNDILTPAEQSANNMVTITAKLAPKSGSAQTRVLSDQTTYIKAEWAANETMKIISANGKEATATVKSVDGSGTATIEFSIDAAAVGQNCTIIYPASAAVAESAGVYTAQPMTAQTGTLSNDLDVRIGKGTISDATTLDVTTQPAAQFAIMKLTLTNDAKNLCIMADNITIAGATLASEGKEFTVAVPAVSSKTVTIVANDASNNCYYFSKAGVSLAAGTYYQSSPSMTALGTESSADVYKITGTSGVTIPDGKTVVLSGVTISDGSIICSGNANIILMGDNTVTGANLKAAIQIGEDNSTTLTITGSGSLTVNGGSQAAAIGTGRAYNANVAGGNIEINGGTIIATGSSGSAAIGTGYANGSSNKCGAITINGGSVTATAIGNAAGIGTGQANGGSNKCGAITINGGTVTATGAGNGAGIGTGFANNSGSNECGAIIISTGVTSVTATKANSIPNIIGKGKADGGTQTCGTITFGAAQVFNGSNWSTDPMAAGTYGGLNLAITNSNKTWTLTPAP